MHFIIDQHDYMTQCYISNQIILFLYDELSALDHLETEYAIENNPQWRKKYLQLSHSHNKLPRVQFYPKKRILRSILDYSATSAA